MCLISTPSDINGIPGVQSLLVLLSIRFRANPTITVISYPVSKDASASVGGLDVSDVGEMNLFGKNQQQQTLHPHRCDLDRDGDRYIWLFFFLFN